MKSLTKREGKRGILSYGLYMMYKDHFRYSLKDHDGERSITNCGQSTINGFKYIDKKSEANVPYHIWLRICKKFNHLKMLSILSGIVFKLPRCLGSIGIIQLKKKIGFDRNGNLKRRHLSIDWNATLILWRKIYPECVTRNDYKKIKDKPLCYFTNEITDGRIFTFIWKRKYANIRNLSAYTFRIAKLYRYALRDIILKNPNIQFCTKF